MVMLMIPFAYVQVRKESQLHVLWNNAKAINTNILSVDVILHIIPMDVHHVIVKVVIKTIHVYALKKLKEIHQIVFAQINPQMNQEHAYVLVPN